MNHHILLHIQKDPYFSLNLSPVSTDFEIESMTAGEMTVRLSWIPCILLIAEGMRGFIDMEGQARRELRVAGVRTEGEWAWLSCEFN